MLTISIAAERAQQQSYQVRAVAAAARGVIDFFWICLCIGNGISRELFAHPTTKKDCANEIIGSNERASYGRLLLISGLKRWVHWAYRAGYSRWAQRERPPQRQYFRSPLGDCPRQTDSRKRREACPRLCEPADRSGHRRELAR